VTDLAAVDRSLALLGWTPDLAAGFAPFSSRGWRPARISVEHRAAYSVRAPGCELEPAAWIEGTAAVSGRYRHEALGPDDFPAVGDWVAIDGDLAEDRATIHALVPRRTAFARLAAGRRTEAQVVAANVDTVFVAMAVDGDFNLRRLERYLSVAWSSGAEPVVLLTKADELADEPAALADRTIAVETIAPTVPVLTVSALHGIGLDAVLARLPAGRTAVVLGSSGVGKSTLINALLGSDALPTGAVRDDDDRGRHTTSVRQLIAIPNAGLVIDTPGMRELGMWEGGPGLGEAFADVDELARSCRFSDCRHEREPGCAVQAAIRDGTLPSDRLRNRRKLEREAARTEGRRTPQERVAARRMFRQYRNAATDAIARKAADRGWIR
jgi:ribosome biogenesis GTPase